MRQEYDAPGGVDMHRVAVDDTETTNIAEHFVPTARFIDAALDNGQGVLVHCQAGVSRSTTLVAAFLMQKLGLNVEQAVDKIRSVRPQVEPTQFFLLQLEMFERCQCEWDPVKVSSSIPISSSSSLAPELKSRRLTVARRAKVPHVFRSITNHGSVPCSPRDAVETNANDL